MLEIDAFNSVGSFRIQWQTVWYLCSSKGRNKLVLCWAEWEQCIFCSVH